MSASTLPFRWFRRLLWVGLVIEVPLLIYVHRGWAEVGRTTLVSLISLALFSLILSVPILLFAVWTPSQRVLAIPTAIALIGIQVHYQRQFLAVPAGDGMEGLWLAAAWFVSLILILSVFVVDQLVGEFRSRKGWSARPQRAPNARDERPRSMPQRPPLDWSRGLPLDSAWPNYEEDKDRLSAFLDSLVGKTLDSVEYNCAGEPSLFYEKAGQHGGIQDVWLVFGGIRLLVTYAWALENQGDDAGLVVCPGESHRVDGNEKQSEESPWGAMLNQPLRGFEFRWTWGGSEPHDVLMSLSFHIGDSSATVALGEIGQDSESEPVQPDEVHVLFGRSDLVKL